MMPLGSRPKKGWQTHRAVIYGFRKAPISSLANPSSNIDRSMPHWCGIEGEAVKVKSWESIMNIRRFNQLIFLITATLAVAGCVKNPESSSSSYTAQTTVLTAQNGMTLYVFDKDQDYELSCYDKCAVNWPPYAGTADETKPESGN